MYSQNECRKKKHLNLNFPVRRLRQIIKREARANPFDEYAIEKISQNVKKIKVEAFFNKINIKMTEGYYNKY